MVLVTGSTLEIHSLEPFMTHLKWKKSEGEAVRRPQRTVYSNATSSLTYVPTSIH